MRLTTIATLAAAVMLTAGCQLGGPLAGQERSASATTVPAKQATTSPPTPADKVLASREGAAHDAKFRVEVVQLLRRDRFVNLTFTATVLEASGGLGWSVHNSFSAVPSANPTVDGVFLVDVKNAKKHLVAVDSEGKCVCSRIEGLNLKKDQTGVFSATFAAPPSDVGSVDVHIPNVGTLANVPIS